MFLKEECAVLGTLMFFLNFIFSSVLATLPPLGAPSLAYTTKGGGYSEPPRRCEKKSLSVFSMDAYAFAAVAFGLPPSPVPNGKGAMGGCEHDRHAHGRRDATI